MKLIKINLVANEPGRILVVFVVDVSTLSNFLDEN